jgi:MFS transporter, DHA2 family, metal-tetracycline-proton antiporter
VVAFLVVASGAMVNVSLPAVGAHYGAPASTSTWLITAYTLTFAVMGAVHGRAASIVGARRLYLASLLLIGVSALATTFAPSIGLMIAMRALQGVGAAAIPALGTLLVTRLTTPEQRGPAVGMLLGASGLATTVGPILGGVLVQYAEWRLVFAIPALVVALIPLGVRHLPRSLDERDPASCFDLLGAALLCAGVGSVMLGITTLRSSAVAGAALLGAGAVLLALLVAWSRRAADPFVPPALLRAHGFVRVAAITLLSQATRVGVGVLTPILLIEVHGIPPAWVGPILLPSAVLVAKLSPIAGRWSGVAGPRTPVGLGVPCILAGTLITAATAGASWPGICAGALLCGCGFALVQSPSVSAVGSLVPPALVGAGLGIFMMLSFLGAALGPAVAAAVLELHDDGGAAGHASSAYAHAIYVVAIFGVAALPLIPRLRGRKGA